MFVKVKQVVMVKKMLITSCPITANFLHEILCLTENTSETRYLYVFFKINQGLNLCNSQDLQINAHTQQKF